MTSNTANNGGISASSLYTPYAAHVGADGKLYVADYNNNRILIFNTIPTSDYSSADVVVGQPNMASNTGNNGGIGANTIYNPTGVTTYNGKLITAEYSNSRVLIFNSIPTADNAAADVVVGQPDMFHAGGVTVQTTGVTASTLFMPMRLMYDGSKTVVTDYANHRILIYNGLPSTSGVPADVVVGQVDMESRTAALAANRLGWVSGGGFSDGAKLFIADSGYNRVLIYNSIPTTNNASADVVIGQPNKTSSTANNGGISAKSLSGGGKLYSDGTRLFVADSGNHRVLIFTSIPTTDFASADVVIGQPNMTSNTANNGGVSDHSLNSPQSVHVKNGKLYIADTSNQRVLIFNTIPTTDFASADVVIGQPDMVSNVLNNGGIGNKTLNLPIDVFVDELNNVVISDYYNSRALIFNGTPTTNFAEATAVVGQTDFNSSKVGAYNYGFSMVRSAYIADRKLYVADGWGDRILGFALGPQNGNVSLGAYVNSSNINLSLSADDAKDVKVSENANLSGATWQPFDASYAFTLSSGDGAKTVYVKYRDFANYEGSVLSAATTLDTGAPTGTVSINGGTVLTNSQNATLTLSATDATTSVTQMMFSESATFTGASWGAYATSKVFTLSTGDVLKTVYVKYKDAAGNESEAYSSTITLDTTIPTIKITDLGLIDNVPDKTPLYYYFTSQTPHIKGITEALSTIHFTYEENDYTTTANSSGNYEIDIPELPRQYVELEYYAVDPAGNQSSTRLLKLMIGVENFPAELLPQEKISEATETTSGEVIPTPTGANGEPPTETIKVFGIQVTDQDGVPLAETAVYIDGQKYVTDKNGKIFIEKKPTAEMTLEVEVNGQRVKGNILGEKIVAEAVTKGPDKKGMATRLKVSLWVLALGGIGYGVVRLVRYFPNKK